MKITQFKVAYKDYFPVGEGWRSLVEKLVDDIILIDKNVEVFQVKEKFGTLRFYISSANDKAHDLINKAEDESGKICEECGTIDNVTTEGEWLKTLCEKCRRGRE